MTLGPVDDQSEDLPAACIDFVLSLAEDVARDARAPEHQQYAI